MRDTPEVAFGEMVKATVLAFEALGRDAKGSLAELYAGDAGEKLAEFLRGLAGATGWLRFPAGEWPEVMAALIGPEMVKPSQGAERRIAIWGALEARLQSVDTLVVGGLNEGSWPRRAEADRFMSGLMKSGLDLEPPERRIGQAAHDFTMALGTRARDPDAFGAFWRSAGRAVALAAAADDLCRQRGGRERCQSAAGNCSPGRASWMLGHR